MEINYKQTIVEYLRLLQLKEKLSHDPRSKYKERAYKNAIDNILLFTHTIKSMDDVQNIKGIGKSIKEKIEYIIQNHGKKDEQSLMRKEEDIIKLTQIYGIGIKKALELVNKGVYFSNLHKHLHELNPTQRRGFELLDDFNERIPFKEMQKHEFLIKKIIQSLKIKPTPYVSIVGSYRRKEASSGDIDVLISSSQNDTLNLIVNKLKEEDYIRYTFAQGTHKFMGSCKITDRYRRLDILITHPNIYPFALLYFTGSPEFNVLMRKHALEMGYSLSEYGIKKLKRNNEIQIDFAFRQESDIFAFLGLRYLPPSKRYATYFYKTL